MRKPRTMSHQRARFRANPQSFLFRIRLALGPLWLVACTSTELEVPVTHPGSPRASAGRVAQTEALTAAYGLEAGVSEPAATSNDHRHHHHGAEGRRGDSAKAPAVASAPIAAAGFTCPMHPEVVRKEPGKCPICGMNLVPKKDAK